MGGTESKAAIDQLAHNISNIAMRNVSRCVSSTNQSQNITITNTGFRFWTSYKIKQTSAIKSTCVHDAALQAKLQNEIINAISQASSSEGIALLSAFGNTTASATANLRTIIESNVTMDNVMENYNSVEQAQNIQSINNYIWVFDNLEAVQGAEIFAASTLKAIEDAGVFNIITNHLDQSASAKEENPMSWLSDLIGGAYKTLLFVLLFIVLVIIALVYSARSGYSGRGEPDILVQVK